MDRPAPRARWCAPPRRSRASRARSRTWAPRCGSSPSPAASGCTAAATSCSSRPATRARRSSATTAAAPGRRSARAWTPPPPAPGAAYTGLTIRGQRTRWASCSSTGAMSFNWRLLLAPEAVLDYVIEHEVCHLEVMDHSPRFWALLESRVARLARARRLAAPLRLDARALNRHAAQGGVGVLAVARLDDPAPQPPGPGLGGAVAADVDARAHAGAAQLRARRDLLRRARSGARAGRPCPRRGPAAAARAPLLEQRQRRVERVGRRACRPSARGARPRGSPSAGRLQQRRDACPSARSRSRCCARSARRRRGPRTRPRRRAVSGPPKSSVQAVVGGRSGSTSAGASAARLGAGRALARRAAAQSGSPSPARGRGRRGRRDHQLRDGLAGRRGRRRARPRRSPRARGRARSTPGSAAPSHPHYAAAAAPSQLSRRRRSPRGARRPRRGRASARPRRRRARLPCQTTARRWPSPDGSRCPRPSASPDTSCSNAARAAGRPPLGTAIENQSLPIISGSSSPTTEHARALASSTRPSRSSTTISAPAASR